MSPIQVGPDLSAALWFEAKEGTTSFCGQAFAAGTVFDWFDPAERSPDADGDLLLVVRGDKRREVLGFAPAKLTPVFATTTTGSGHIEDPEPLGRVFRAAAKQALDGKGAERHVARTEPFDEQPIVEMAERLAHGSAHAAIQGPLYQAVKKVYEASGLYLRDTTQGPSRAKRELYGAMNYLAAAVLLIEKAEKETNG